MSISLEPNKGLRVKLGRLSAIRTWQGGGNFWSHEFQLTVRSGALAGFLPRAIEDEDSVLFEHRTGGTEVASTSSAISNVSEIPAKELNALRAAVDELKRKAQDPHCDRTKRQMIEGFRLPDPQKDRDLYRLVGKGSSAKLIVLWGLEREEGSALAPGAAVDLMHTPRDEGEGQAAPAAKKSSLLPALVVIALVAAGGYFIWQKNQNSSAEPTAAPATVQPSDDRIAAFNAQATPTTSPVTSTAPEEPPPPEGAVVSDEKGNVTGIMGKDGKLAAAAAPGITVNKEGKLATTPKPGEVLKASDGKVAGVVDKDGKVVAATPGKTVTSELGKPVTAPAGTVVKDTKGVVTGVVDKDGKVVGAAPGVTADKDGKVTAAKPGTVFRDEKGAVTGVCGGDGKVTSAKTGTVATRPAGSFNSSGTYTRTGSGTGSGTTSGTYTRTGTGTTTPTTGSGTTSGTFNRTGTSTTTPTTGSPSPTANKTTSAGTTGSGTTSGTSTGSGSPTTPPPAPAEAPGSTATPMTTKGPPPAGISAMTVVSTSLSAVLGNGNVEVLLNVVARDMSGAVIAAPTITGWKVNDVMQNKPDGSPADGPVLPVSLPPGTHRISTVGRGSDGQPFQTDAEVVVTPKS